MPDGASARKVAEEAIELVEECARDVPDRTRVMHEVADVVLAALVVAEHHGFTLEEALTAKIDLDTGRDRSESPPRPLD
jgi:phosphoribosyl-ATP pyrophosphohydrolase